MLKLQVFASQPNFAYTQPSFEMQLSHTKFRQHGTALGQKHEASRFQASVLKAVHANMACVIFRAERLFGGFVRWQPVALQKEAKKRLPFSDSLLERVRHAPESFRDVYAPTPQRPLGNLEQRRFRL